MTNKKTGKTKKNSGPAHLPNKNPASKKPSSASKKYIAVLGISLAVLLCTFFVAMGFGFSSYMGHSLSPSPAVTDEPEITDDSLVPVDKATGKINILLLGVDVEGLRTDTIIVLSYDLDEGKVNMLSVPRDTRMYVGKKYQKINASHAITQSGNIKGPQGSIEAVTRLTGIPINYYVEFSFSAFRNTIDSLGGVYFDVPRDMNYEDPVQDLYIHLKKGYQLLDGDKSEQLVRFRRYAMGDIERVEMQQKFISALLEQKLRPETLKNLPALFEQWKNDIDTNLSIADMLKLIPNISDLSTENIKMYSVPGHYNDTDYGASYWIANMKELAALVETEFEYDASKITIHSPDGSSVSKDKKTSSSSAGSSSEKTSQPKPAETDTPSDSPNTESGSSATSAPAVRPTYPPAPSMPAITFPPHTSPAGTGSPAHITPPNTVQSSPTADTDKSRQPNTQTPQSQTDKTGQPHTAAPAAGTDKGRQPDTANPPVQTDKNEQSDAAQEALKKAALEEALKKQTPAKTPDDPNPPVTQKSERPDGADNSKLTVDIG
ncbi:MAG: LCP family protein [Oscillospiraceae bacterium]|nr:LCP family protein [Oscillospiraceae bacterium]